ncbi:hypothetical protein, partial [Burkholderia gladioli]
MAAATAQYEAMIALCRRWLGPEDVEAPAARDTLAAVCVPLTWVRADVGDAEALRVDFAAVRQAHGTIYHAPGVLGDAPLQNLT